METVKEYVNHELTDEEKDAIAREVVETMANTRELESELDLLKQRTKAVANRIEQDRLNCHELGIIYQRGWKVEEMECPVEYENGVATIIHPETGEVVRRRPMTPDEKQRRLDFDNNREVMDSEVDTIFDGSPA